MVLIGEPFETECVSHYELNPLIPWGWSHLIELGGGRSEQQLHAQAVDCACTRSTPTLIDINGEARNDMHRAPVVDGVHDFRERGRFCSECG